MFSFIYDKVLHKGACISKIHAHTANTPLTSSMSVQKGKKKASLALFSYNSVAKKKYRRNIFPLLPTSTLRGIESCCIQMNEAQPAVTAKSVSLAAIYQSLLALA